MEMPNIVPDLTGPESQKARKPERNEPEGDLALASTWGKAALRMPVAVLVRVPATLGCVHQPRPLGPDSNKLLTLSSVINGKSA